MPSAFTTVGVIGRVRTTVIQETIITLIHYLKSLGQSFLVEEQTAESLNATIRKNIKIVPRDLFAKMCHLVIVVGGDGSLLQAAHSLVETNTPILGINRGSLGFLTDVKPSEITQIKKILAGEYHSEKRFFLKATIQEDSQPLEGHYALNEVAILPAQTPHMCEFEIYIDDEFVCSERSDGLIIATPTGSTAYALSAGGPILHPALDALAVVSICPHSLNQRPIVIEGNRKLKIIISEKNKSEPRISCDGQTYLPAPLGSQVIIEKSNSVLNLIHPKGYHYFESLRSKLHWGKKLQQMDE